MNIICSLVFHVLAATQCITVLSHAEFSAPPVLLLDREWKIPDNEEVGSVVTRVQADVGGRNRLVFGIEPKDNGDETFTPLPFRIDNQTGVVYLNGSLKGRGGTQLLLYITGHVSGGLPVKSEVLVKIIDSSADKDIDQGIPAIIRSKPSIYNGPSFIPKSSTSTFIRISTLRPVKYEVSTPTTREELSTEPDMIGNVPINNFTATSTENGSTVVSSKDGTSQLAFTLVPVISILGLFLLGVIFIWVFKYQICCNKSKGSKDDIRKEMSIAVDESVMGLQLWRGPRAFSNRYEPDWEKEGNTNLQNIKFSDKWEFPRHHLKVFNILGEGCFGQVWRCEALEINGIKGTSVVAVKTLKENASEKEKSDLLQELEIMKMLEPHTNIVRLLGCCTEKDPVFLIMEFVQHGKLQSFLRNSRAERCYGNLHGPSKTLTSRDLTSFAYQVARGMEFLSSKGIIHRDLAARNILVAEDHVCKVADFGFARDVVSSHVYERKSEGRLPIRWMAPESLYDNIYSVKSDVWSFAVLVWEIVTLGSTPYPGLAAAEVMKHVRDGYRLEKPEHCRRELYNIMYYCWDKDVKERPTFNDLVVQLGNLLQSDTEYIELERFPDHSYYNMINLSGEKL